MTIEQATTDRLGQSFITDMSGTLINVTLLEYLRLPWCVVALPNEETVETKVWYLY